MNAMASVIHARDLVHQRYAVVDRGESHVLGMISIIVLILQASPPVHVETQVRAVREQQTHAPRNLQTLVCAIVVAEALVRTMKSAIVALVTVALIQRAKSPPTPATDPTVYVVPAPNVPERM